MCKQFNGAGCWLSLRPKRTGCDKQAERTALRAARRGALREGVVGPRLKTLRELLGAALCAVRYTSAEQLGAQEGLDARCWPRIPANKTPTQMQKTDAPRETQTIIAKCRQGYVSREIFPSLIRLGKVFS